MTQFVIILYEAAAIIYDPERGMALRVPRVRELYRGAPVRKLLNF